MTNEDYALVVESCEDTGDAVGIERDVFIWNKAVAYCAAAIRKLVKDDNVD